LSNFFSGKCSCRHEGSKDWRPKWLHAVTPGTCRHGKLA
jgi:hypothetical protein